MAKPKTIGERVATLAAECEGTVYEGYSGRSMYGKRCWGVVCDDPFIKNQAKTVGLPPPRVDNLGLSFIHYWPTLEYLPAQD